MMTLRASEQDDPTPAVPLTQSSSVTTFTPAAELGSQAILFTRDTLWIAGSACLYLVLVLAAVLTLHPYFSQTWDAVTFVNAAKSVLSPDWTQLYALSRAERTWAYAYPPLHAFVTAPFVALAAFLPDWLLVRVPPMLFDVGLGILLYEIIARKTESINLARLALVIWLLNPVTWYDTAVQGHFEAEWLFFVVLAYWFNDTRRGWLLSTLSLAIATLFKQNALLFALPFWAQMFFTSDLSLRGVHAERERTKQSPIPAFQSVGSTMGLKFRVLPVLASMLVYALPIVIVSLPFLFASNDFLYMNVQYVADVPLQTQSWLVGLAGILSPDNIILRQSSTITLIAVALISIWGARRKLNLWLIGTLIVLAFFLLSKKVVGYYYVMLLPFSVVTLIPAFRFRLLALIILATSFISLSPYFASWTDQSHWWVYALLGTANSVLWLGVFIWLWRERRPSSVFGDARWNASPTSKVYSQNARLPAFLSIALFWVAVAAALLQPFINNPGSPIRAPLIPSGSEIQTTFAFLGFALLTLVATLAAVWYTSAIARESRIPASAYALVVLLAPLFFLTFTLTKESTAALELVLKTLGI